MKTFTMLVATLVLGMTFLSGDAWAQKRLGGGKSVGMQRQATPPAKAPTATPAQTAPTAAAAAPGTAMPQAQPKRSWLGPIAGIAAGLGLAALASHLGFGEELASFMMMALLAVVVIGVIGYFMRRKAGAKAGGWNPAQPQDMQYAGAAAGGSGAPAMNMPPPAEMPGGSTSAGGSRFAGLAPLDGAPASVSSVTKGNIPADFDMEGFARIAKLSFIRLQAANDAGDLNDLREFTTPEIFAEIRMAISERGQATQRTDVVKVEAELLDVAEEEQRDVVSVRFTGQISEDGNAPASFDEIWHLVKQRDGGKGWLLSGIQQVQ